MWTEERPTAFVKWSRELKRNRSFLINGYQMQQGSFPEEIYFITQKKGIVFVWH